VRLLIVRMASSSPSARQELLGRSDSATFNQSLLDLGAQYCKSSPNCELCPVASHCRWRVEGGIDPASKSAVPVGSRPQSRFAGSDRQLRGTVLKELREGQNQKSRSSRSLIVLIRSAARRSSRVWYVTAWCIDAVRVALSGRLNTQRDR